MNRFIMKNAPPPSTKKSAQTNTRTTAKNGAAKNRAKLNVGEPLETTNKGVSISIDELSIDDIKKLTRDNALKLCQFHKISNATNMARMAKNNNSRKLCYIEALCEFKNNKINEKK